MLDLSVLQRSWAPPELPQEIPHGDMPGDKVSIGSGHIQKANTIFPRLMQLLYTALSSGSEPRAVVSVCGGSGVGKSEIASLLTYYLNQLGVGAYTLSGDNYPHRIPLQNDAERIRVFRVSGMRSLLASGGYSEERARILHECVCAGSDADPNITATHSWMAAYQKAGRAGLKGYLGTQNEIDFAELSEILARFHSGADDLWLKRMGREETALWYERVDARSLCVLVVEWTHGNNDLLHHVDIPILLNSTPKETLEHRRLRARDGAPDSPFTTMVLELEQELLISQAHKAKLIVSKSGELLTFEQYMRLLTEQ
ncbi:MAG TPA: adenylylsulfate kinase [Feifaniaceae bacterium]|nr:adenylylsulfate kinase [Feifaniaceae bacterium]